MSLLCCRYKRIGSGVPRSPTLSPVKASKSPTRQSRSPSKSSPSRSRSLSATNKLENALRTAEEERDFYKLQYDNMVRDT